ncbi:MAG TPA: hypothetical protein VK897_17730 [Anaerolineales bacterium]|nr:hypothetical protein [Anaerolineales bacterium]
MLKRLFEVNFFLANILVPVIALALYCGSFAYFASHFQLRGVNYFFAIELGKYLLFVIAGLLVIFLVIRQRRPGDILTFKHSEEKLYPSDFLLLLLPVILTVQYILNNRAILSPQDWLYVLLIVAVVSGFYTFVLPVVLRKVMPTRTLMILGLAFVFTIVSMALVSHYFTWFEKGALGKQLIILGGVFLVILLLYNLNQRRILHLLIIVNLVANSSLQLLSQVSKTNTSTQSMNENKLLSLVQGKKPARTPNIYLLVYDAYIPNETMLAHGIDNSAQEAYLTQQGFKLYPHTYSIEASTFATMSPVLNASTEYYGDARRAVSGDGVTQKILKNLGYETYGLFPSGFAFEGVRSSYDYITPGLTIPSYAVLLKAISLGEFRFDVEQVGLGKQHRQQFIAYKRNIFRNASSEQKMFMYMHSNKPSHTQISGTCLPNEKELFQRRLKTANVEMKKDVNLIVAHDPDAIVIVAGDHGPHLTKNCNMTTGVYDASEISRLDIQDRHGTFLAIRWPTGDFTKYDHITVLQDLFPAVFAYLYQDATLLQAKIDPVILTDETVSGVSVRNGIIEGGTDDGEPLFLSDSSSTE